MKIGLMGFEFSSPNKGCEALSYSFVSLLSKLCTTKIEIYNFTNCEMGQIPGMYSNRCTFFKIVPSIKDKNYLKALMDCDIIFDVTMGDSFSDIYSKQYYNSLIRDKILAEFFCKKYILLPQTYGPFNDIKSKKKAKKVFKKAYKIFCKDELSKNLLENDFNINDSVLMSDMAFLLPYDKKYYKFNTTKIKIGLNISGLLYRGGFHSKNQFNLTLNYREYINKLLDYYATLDNFEIHLIPHVIDLNENSYDDDYKISMELQKKYNNIILAPVFSTPIEAKSYISNMDYFIGSRMHSTIAAFSSNVKTIPVSYSRKFEGLFNSLNYDYVINGRKETTTSAFENTLHYISNGDDLFNKQIESLKIISEKNNQFVESISKLLTDLD